MTGITLQCRYCGRPIIGSPMKMGRAGDVYHAECTVPNQESPEQTVRIAQLESALAPFAAAASRYDPVPDATIGDSVQLWQDGRRVDFINVGHLRAARDVLTK